MEFLTKSFKNLQWEILHENGFSHFLFLSATFSTSSIRPINVLSVQYSTLKILFILTVVLILD